jgi:hypothetical protein
VNENAMGELGYYTLLGQFISEAEAKSVAGGWKADRYMVFEDPAAGRYALVARTRWASPETSLAFFRDYHAILARKYAELASDLRSTEETYIGSTHSGKVILLREGDECLWVEGVPEAEVEPMLAYLRAQAKRAARAALFRSEVNQRGSVQYHSGSPNLAQ